MSVGDWTPATTTSMDQTGNPVGWVNDGVDLGADEFVIYRLDMNLHHTADDCYQDATYLYDLAVESKQLEAPSF